MDETDELLERMTLSRFSMLDRAIIWQTYPLYANFYATEIPYLKIILSERSRKCRFDAVPRKERGVGPLLFPADFFCSRAHRIDPRKTKGGTKAMRRTVLFNSLNAIEALELRLSLSSVAAAMVGSLDATVTAVAMVPVDNDPLPNPEPPPPPDPGNNPPVVYPALPSSGPPGPGS